MDSKILLSLLAVVAVVLSGCHAPETPVDTGDDGDGMGGDAPGDGMDDLELTLTAEDAPATASVNDTLTVNVTVDANHEVTSTHSGFHYGFNSSADLDPSEYTTVLDMTSPHLTNETTYPGSYTVEDWSFGEEHAGKTVYVRAHTQADGQDFWGDEFTIELTA